MGGAKGFEGVQGGGHGAGWAYALWCMARRVFITGIGSVCGLGVGAQTLWDGLRLGTCCIKPITRFDASGFRVGVAGEVQNFSAKDFVPKSYRKATKVMARDIELAVGAAKSAVENAGLQTRGTGDEVADTVLTYPPARMGCHIGAGLIAAETDEMSQAMATAKPDGQFSLRAWGGEGGGGMEALTPLWLLKYLPNMLACHVTIIHGAEGPSNTITCSEASGLLSVGESMRVIQRGAADMCFSGSVESKLNPMGLLRMDLAERLASVHAGADMAGIVRPYDPKGPGGALGEGGAICILECADTAQARGAQVYAELVGYGGGQSDARYSAGDADEGYRFAIENALADAGLRPDQIGLIVPMASGVRELDAAELGALRSVFGTKLAEIEMVSLHALIGNAVAGSGGLQIAAAALCVKNQMVPARIHAGTPPAGVRIGAAAARTLRIEYALVCSGSLGGQNAAVVLKAV